MKALQAFNGVSMVFQWYIIRGVTFKRSVIVNSSYINCSCANFRVSVNNVIDAVLSMKKGKCQDDSQISAEHFFHAPLPLYQRLQHLFNKEICHQPKPYRDGVAYSAELWSKKHH